MSTTYRTADMTAHSSCASIVTLGTFVRDRRSWCTLTIANLSIATATTPCAVNVVKSALTPEQAAKAAKAAAPRIAFSVIELTGKELPMTTLSALHTVGELKLEVARASGTRIDQVRLVLKNEVLDDESATLGEYGMEAGSQVNVVSQ